MLKEGLTVHYEPFAQGYDTKVFIREFIVDISHAVEKSWQ